jgi:hypothetical protein
MAIDAVVGLFRLACHAMPVVAAIGRTLKFANGKKRPVPVIGFSAYGTLAAPPYGPAMLVTQDPQRARGSQGFATWDL